MKILRTLNHTINTSKISSLEVVKTDGPYDLQVHWEFGTTYKTETIYQGAEKECQFLGKKLGQDLAKEKETFMSISLLREMASTFKLKEDEYKHAPSHWAVDLTHRYEP